MGKALYGYSAKQAWWREDPRPSVTLLVSDITVTLDGLRRRSSSLRSDRCSRPILGKLEGACQHRFSRTSGQVSWSKPRYAMIGPVRSVQKFLLYASASDPWIRGTVASNFRHPRRDFQAIASQTPLNFEMITTTWPVDVDIAMSRRGGLYAMMSFSLFRQLLPYWYNYAVNSLIVCTVEVQPSRTGHASRL